MVAVDWNQVKEHLDHLGRDPEESPVFFFLWRKGTAELNGFGHHIPKNGRPIAKEVESYLNSKANLSLGFVVNPGGTKKAEIKHGIALFTEDDSGASIDDQMASWQTALLPEPSLSVFSGSKSVHHYWVFSDPVPSDRFESLQKRLAAVMQAAHPSGGTDKSLADACQVMRVAGAPHPKTGDIATIKRATGERFQPTDIEKVLANAEQHFGIAQPQLTPEPQPPTPTSTTTNNTSPRTVHLSELLPKEQSLTFASGVSEGSRNDACYRLAVNLLAIESACSMQGSFNLGFHVQGSAAGCLEDFNHRCSPPLPDAELQVILSSASRSDPEPDPGLAERIRYHRNRLNPDPQHKASEPVTKKVKPSLQGLDISHELTPIDQWDQLLRALVNPSHPAFELNSVRRQIRALTAARELGIAANPTHTRATLIQHQRNLITGTDQKGTRGGDKAKFKPKQYLINNLIAQRCLTGIAAFNKVGKTKLATELASSLIHQHPFMGNPDWTPAPPPEGGHKLILWWVDQPGADSSEYLKARGLMQHDGTLHPQIVALYTEDDDLSWDDQGIDLLIRITADNPGAILITDSFFACIQRIHGSDQEPEAGGALIDVQTILSQSQTTHICLFHSPKETGPVGINAIRGHGSAGGAVSGVISLHFLETKCPNTGKWVADKDNPHRRMVFEGRGPYIDLLIKGNWEQGTFQVLGNFQKEIAQLTANQRKASAIDDLTEGQRQTLEWVGTAAGIWKDPLGVSASQVSNAMTQPRQASHSEVTVTRKQLQALRKLGLLSENKKGSSTLYKISANNGC